MPFWGKWESFTHDLSKFRRQVQHLRASESGQTLKIAANVPLRIASESVEFATDTPQTAEQIIDALQLYLEAGLEYVIWNIQSNELIDYIKQVRLAVEKVMPAIQGV